jgi:hypothetical protein
METKKSGVLTMFEGIRNREEKLDLYNIGGACRDRKYRPISKLQAILIERK